MSSRSFILLLILIFFIMALVWFVNEVSKLSENKQKENVGVIVIMTWIAPFLLVMLLLLAIKSIQQDRAQERYYISRTKHESEKGIK